MNTFSSDTGDYIKKRLDLTGRVFGRLTVIEPAPDKKNKTRWICKCKCGETIAVYSNSLIQQNTRSCGCLHIDTITTHRGINLPEYRIWAAMKSRCYGKSNSRYNCYGGRGIKVCNRWLNSFENFFLDMGARPSQEYSIDRIDNNLDYSPDNCRWATAEMQSNNKRTVEILSIDGKSQSRAQWARQAGIASNTIKRRIENGLSVKDAITRPADTSKVRHKKI